MRSGPTSSSSSTSAATPWRTATSPDWPVPSATPTGDEIEIEERDPEEVTHIGATAVAPVGAPAVNFAFDVTPHELVTAIVTEAAVLRPPYEESIASVLES